MYFNIPVNLKLLVSYKPSTSTGKFTIFQYSTSVTGGEDGREEKAVQSDEEEQTRRRSKEDEDFQKAEIQTLISGWESRAGGGNGLKPPELEDRGRRRSQEFTNLRLKLMEQSGGVGDECRYRK